MRIPTHLFSMQTIRAEPWMAAMSVVALGMFVGAWIVGPALTHGDGGNAPPINQDKMSYEDMLARPDPAPYRAATPAFDASGAPSYAEQAKAKAQAEAGDNPDDDVTATQAPRRSWRYPTFDRHRVY